MDKAAHAQMIERIVPWTINGVAQPSFLCTPDALDELALGHMLAQGMINDAASIEAIAADDQRVDVRMRGMPNASVTLEARMAALQPVSVPKRASLAEMSALMKALADVEVFYGTHCLALQMPDGHTVFREDVGRHNALDKVIGRGAMDDVDFSQCVVAATGRISLEMLLKAATVGVPFIVSKKYPSDLSVALAERLSITIVGRALSAQPVIYSGRKNMIDNL